MTGAQPIDAERGLGAPPPVLTERRGLLGVVTLNRPSAMNALTHEMVVLVRDALVEWAVDDAVATVAIVGAGDRGLCAGGDVVSLHRAATEGPAADAVRFWADEYALNAMIAAYPKPYVAIQDGVVLGGGIGVSAHGSHRVATERSKIGFPEVTIGFVPDVGATWLLSRAPGELGMRVALSGANLSAADAIEVGLADTFVPSDRLPELLERLESANADDAVEATRGDVGPSVLATQRAWSDAAFGSDSVADIIEALHAVDVPESQTLAESITAKSPLALEVTHAALRRARSASSLPEALRTEFRISTHHLIDSDFPEGVRAQLIDKDRSPAWMHADTTEVEPSRIEAFFTDTTWEQLLPETLKGES